MDAPKKRYEVTIKVSGHTWERAMRMLDEFHREIDQHGEECGLVSGGGGYIQVEMNPEMTEEEFNAQLQKWCEENREKRKAEAAK